MKSLGETPLDAAGPVRKAGNCQQGRSKSGQ
jgi:hypothetical protein